MALSLNGSGGITYPDGSVNNTRSVSVAGDSMLGLLTVPSLNVTTGNVGIGTNLPAHRLDVNGNIITRGINWGAAGSAALNYFGDTNNLVGSTFNGNTILRGFNGVSLQVGAGTNRLTIDASGVVRVDGGIRARGGSPGAGGINNNGYAFEGSGGDNDSGMYSLQDGHVQFFTNSVFRFQLDASARVASTQSGGFADRTFNLDGPSLTNPGIGFHASGSGSAGILKFHGPGNRFEFRNSNDSSFGSILANDFTVASDYRLKINIEPIVGGLSSVMSLKPKTYKMFESGNLVRGFIAHEVAQYIPEAVKGEFNAEDERGFPVYQTLDPASILATAVAAIQELKALVDQQAIEIQQLKENLNA